MAQDRPRKYFFGVFEKFETFFSKICAHSERYRNLLAGIFEILTFNGNIAFLLSPVLHAFFFQILLFFPEYWNVERSRYFALLLVQSMQIFPVFPVFLGKKSGKEMFDRNGPY